MVLRVAVFALAVGFVSVLVLPWQLVALAAGSFIAGAFAMGLMRASAAGDRQMEAATPIAELSADPSPLALRVRRAASRWPLTELDPIERATFAGAEVLCSQNFLFVFVFLLTPRGPHYTFA